MTVDVGPEVVGSSAGRAVTSACADGKPRRRVLIVTSSYAPAMIADMHRARHLAWELPAFGWAVDILAPSASLQAPSYLDHDSSEFFAETAGIAFAGEGLGAAMRWMGVGSAGWRSFAGMLFRGARLLRERRHDLVYISTTSFQLFALGPLWRQWCGTPYVLDVHDPIYKTEAGSSALAKDGLKQQLSRAFMKHVESYSVTGASGIVSVSPVYLENFRQRYGRASPKWEGTGSTAVVPFSVLPHDFEIASRSMERVGATAPKARIAYVGAGGPIMRRAFALFCDALAALVQRNPALAQAVQIELYGTRFGWRQGDRCDLAEIAREKGVAALVSELPARVTYRRSLELLLSSDGALILGVDDRGYMPSKLYAYGYSGKPLLAVVRRDGPAAAAFENLPELGRVLWFQESGQMGLAQAVETLEAFLRDVAARRSIDRRLALQPFLASQMAQRHAELFERVLTLRPRA